MRNKIYRMTCIIGLILFAVVATALTLQAQTPIDTTVFDNPAGIITQYSIEILTSAITLVLTYFSGLIPGIKKIKAPLIKAIAVGILVVVAVVQTKLGWFTEESFKAVLNTLLPTFAYSGLAWQLIKTLLGFLKVDIVAIQQEKINKLAQEQNE